MDDQGKKPLVDANLSLLFKLADVAFSKRLNHANEEFGLTGNQAQILGCIQKADKDMEIFPSSLEKHLHISRPTMSGILKRLESKGFIIFAPSSKDKRYKKIVLTDKAAALDQRIHETILETEAQMVSDIAPEQIDMVRRLVIQMINNISDSKLDFE